jgi:hypothetical protein
MEMGCSFPICSIALSDKNLNKKLYNFYIDQSGSNILGKVSLIEPPLNEMMVTEVDKLT